MKDNLNIQVPKGARQLCGGGRCPKVFVTEKGDFIIQGIRGDKELVSQLLPESNEEVVILPREFVAELFHNYHPA